MGGGGGLDGGDRFFCVKKILFDLSEIDQKRTSASLRNIKDFTIPQPLGGCFYHTSTIYKKGEKFNLNLIHSLQH